MHVEEYEFYLAKKNIWYVVRDAKLDPHFKQLIMNKVEYARYYLFSDFDLSSKILRKDLSIELMHKVNNTPLPPSSPPSPTLIQHPTFNSYFIFPEDKDIINDMLDCFYGNMCEDTMVKRMLGRLKLGIFAENFFDILTDVLSKWIPVYKGVQKTRIAIFT